jgi:hypothetical protein
MKQLIAKLKWIIGIIMLIIVEIGVQLVGVAVVVVGGELCDGASSDSRAFICTKTRDVTHSQYPVSIQSVKLHSSSKQPPQAHPFPSGSLNPSHKTS